MWSHTKVSSLPGEEQEPTVSSTVVQGSWCQSITLVQVVYPLFSDHKCCLGSPFLLKVGHTASDKMHLSELILSQLWCWPPHTLRRLLRPFPWEDPHTFPESLLGKISQATVGILTEWGFWDRATNKWCLLPCSHGTCLNIVKIRIKTELRKIRTLNYLCSMQKKHQVFSFPLQNCSFYAGVFTMDQPETCLWMGKCTPLSKWASSLYFVC